MTADEVRRRVDTEIAGLETNRYGWNFRSRILATPELREYRDEKDQPWHLWLVLRESDREPCYEVVFDAEDHEFGLAYAGAVVGWYGGFLDAVNGM